MCRLDLYGPWTSFHLIGRAVDLMDNASRCPQPHSHNSRISEGCSLLMEEWDRAEARRRSWVPAYRTLGDAGAVCRRFGISRSTLRKWLGRYERECEVGLRPRSRRPHQSPTLKVGERQEAMILDFRRERRLGVKRLRNELLRLHEVCLSGATIRKVLTRHGLNILPTRKRGRRKPRRYNRPVPGDRVQMDTCKIRPGLYQFTASDDCSRFLAAGLARRRSAQATLMFLDQGVGGDAVPDPAAPDGSRHRVLCRMRPAPSDERGHTVLANPARSPYLNGKVERAQRSVLEEFWAITDPEAADVADPACVVGPPLLLASLTRIPAWRYAHRVGLSASG
jgi:transposase